MQLIKAKCAYQLRKSGQALLPAAVTGLQQDSKAQAEQVRSIAVERLGAVLGRAPSDVMTRLDDALRLHLQL